MLSIFSVQNLQTFLRRKNLRPPSRPEPPGRPPGRGPPCGRGPEGRVVGAPSDGADAGLSGAASLVFSSAITLLIGASCRKDNTPELFIPISRNDLARVSH